MNIVLYPACIKDTELVCFSIFQKQRGEMALSKTRAPAPHYKRTKAILPLFSRTLIQSSNISVISYMSLEHQKEAMFLVSKHYHLVAPADLCKSPIELNELFLVRSSVISDLFLKGRQANEIITRKPILWLSGDKI